MIVESHWEESGRPFLRKQTNGKPGNSFRTSNPLNNLRTKCLCSGAKENCNCTFSTNLVFGSFCTYFYFEAQRGREGREVRGERGGVEGAGCWQNQKTSKNFTKIGQSLKQTVCHLNQILFSTLEAFQDVWLSRRHILTNLKRCKNFSQSFQKLYFKFHKKAVHRKYYLSVRWNDWQLFF